MQKAALIADNATAWKAESTFSRDNEPKSWCGRWNHEPAPGLNGLAWTKQSIKWCGCRFGERIDSFAVGGAQVDNDESLSLGHPTSATREAEPDCECFGRRCPNSGHGVRGNAPVIGTLGCLERGKPLRWSDRDAEQDRKVHRNGSCRATPYSASAIASPTECYDTGGKRGDDSGEEDHEKGQIEDAHAEIRLYYPQARSV
jgi:hypothetical protein